MTVRAFPIVYARDVEASAAFYEMLGFVRHFQLPAEGPPGYIGLHAGAAQMAIVTAQWPAEQYGLPRGNGPVFEMFVYVDDADATFDALVQRGVATIRPPAEMPWGERVAFVLDPDANPVALATEAGEPPRS